MPDSRPRLRSDLEVQSARVESGEAYLIRDALGLIEEPLLLRGAGLMFIRLIDGKRCERDLQLAMTPGGADTLIDAKVIRGWLSELDRAFLLDSDRYRAARDRLLDEYAREPTRVACLAGRAYPSHPQELHAMLKDILKQERPSVPRPAAAIRAVAAPHIDLEIGRRIYARAYNALDSMEPPERILILGTGHRLDKAFSISKKNFLTPLGKTTADREWTSEIQRRGGPALAATDISHRDEHSIEFQLLFLQHLFGCGFKIVPLLCGSIQPLLSGSGRMSEVPGLADVLKVLRACARAPGTLVVAGVDLSHVGLKFGDPRPQEDLTEGAEASDRRLLSALSRGDSRAFWAEAAESGDRYHVCGLSALACLLEILPGLRGRILGYEFWRETATRSAVSYAALAFTDGEPGAAGREIFSEEGSN